MSSRVRVTSAFDEELTPFSAAEQLLHFGGEGLVGEVLAGELGVAAVGRDLARQQHRAHRRLFEIGGIRVPDAAEVVLLALELAHLDHFRKAVDALDERILDRPAHGARERHELRRVELLLAEEDDLVLEEGRSDLFSRKASREIHPEDLGTQRTGELADLYCSTLMFCALMICAVALLLALEERAHLLGRAGARIEAERHQAGLELVGGERFLHLGGQALQRLARCAGRRDVADPRGGVVPGQARRLGERRQLRHRAGAVRGGHAECLQLAGPDVALRGGEGFHRVGHVAVHHVGERRHAALVRDMARLQTGHRVEQLGEQVRGRAGTGRSEGELAGVCLHQRDELLRVPGAGRRMGDERERRQADQAYGREILQRLVRRLLQVRHDRVRPARAREQRVAVGRAFRDRIRADRAARTCAVVDHERLAEHALQLLRDHARGDVGRLPRRPGHDHPDRAVGIGLRECGGRGQQPDCDDDDGFHGSSCKGLPHSRTCPGTRHRPAGSSAR